jgi:ABC-type taurine transport system ATPase subunit
VEQNIELGPRCKGMPRDERKAVAERFLAMVGLVPLQRY